MKLWIDTREQQPLEFPVTVGVEVARKTLQVGDYGAEHASGPDLTVIERKGMGDLFNSYTGGYEQERNKIIKAANLGLTFILAIEASATEVLKGHTYWDGEQRREHRKTGLAMFRQLCTINRKYGVQVWFCTSRTEMAWRILEYFLAQERLS